jgi:hypothetical protein
MKDWNGNSKTAFVCNGTRNFALEDRQEYDYYATEPKATELLVEVEDFSIKIWECACGEGHMADVLVANGYEVYVSDIVERGYACNVIDFLKVENTNADVDIITNPPYRYALEFVEKALDVVADGHKVAMFLKLTFLEGKRRKKFFEKYPPKVVYVSSSRLQCAKNGDFEKYGKGVETAIAYAWYVWEKGYKGDTVVKWIN